MGVIGCDEEAERASAGKEEVPPDLHEDCGLSSVEGKKLEGKVTGQRNGLLAREPLVMQEREEDKILSSRGAGIRY